MEEKDEFIDKSDVSIIQSARKTAKSENNHSMTQEVIGTEISHGDRNKFQAYLLISQVGEYVKNIDDLSTIIITIGRFIKDPVMFQSNVLIFTTKQLGRKHWAKQDKVCMFSLSWSVL